MRLERLQLDNFRGFASLDLELHPRLTVLVGVNGSGKSTILDALAGRPKSALDIRCRDVGDPASPPCRVKAIYDVEGETRTVWSGFANGRFEDRHQSLQGGVPPVAVHLLYGIERTAHDATPGPTDVEAWAPARSNEDGADAGGGGFSAFFSWFRGREDLENQERVAGDTKYSDRELTAVRAAIESILPGWKEPRILRPGGPGNPLQRAVLSIAKDGTRLAFDQLSEGERSLLAMACDIARRLAIANPEGDPLQGSGVVMIDEVDLHLHPKWQVDVLPRLLDTFPKLQFIVTTHSPLVLSRVAPESVRLLEDFEVRTPDATFGRDANALLEEVFGIQLRPAKIAELIDDISRAIDEERLDDARQRLTELSESLGTSDREVTRLRTMIDLLSA